MRKLYVFKHDDPVGNCPSNVLFDQIVVEQNNAPAPPRKFSDYTITVQEKTPEGVQMICRM